MADPLGRELIIRRPDVANPGQFLNACGFNTKNFSLTNNFIERLKLECQNLGNKPVTKRSFGAQDVTFSGNGFAEDDANHKILLTSAVDQLVLTGWQVVIPLMGTFTGDWMIGQVDYTGDETNELGFACSFAQKELLTFAAL